MIVPCSQCGKSTNKYPYQIKASKHGVFCSRPCTWRFYSIRMSASASPSWKGGSKKHSGYIRVFAPWHPSHVQKYVFLHRLVVEARLGRYLAIEEVIHHRDGNKENNHWDNLEVMSRAGHAKHHRPNRWLNHVKKKG